MIKVKHPVSLRVSCCLEAASEVTKVERGGGKEGKAARLCVGGSTKKKAEIGKDGKASVVVV